MRALFILYGAPGVGKSTLIKNLNVEHLTLGFDQTRDLFGIVTPCVDEESPLSSESAASSEGTVRRVRENVEPAVVSATFAALESRMEAGSTVFFDATSLQVRDQNALISRGRRYGYTPYIIDVQGDISFDELRDRNSLRGVRALSESLLHEKWLAGTEKNFAQGVSVISASTTGEIEAIRNQIVRITATPSINTARVIVVGDVHSCAAPLRKALEEHDTPDTHWVFAGDLFERGPDPVGVWEIVTGLIKENRCTVVTGNHESHLRSVNTRAIGGRLRDTVATRDALIEAGVLAQAQIQFVNNTVPALLIDRSAVGGPGSKTPWLVTHGGVGYRTAEQVRYSVHGLLDVSDAECIYGLNEREKAYRGKTSYNVDRIELAGYQLHGHRNGRVGTAVDTIRDFGHGPVVCLESGASTGGSMSVAVLEENAVHGAQVYAYADGVDPERAALYSQKPWERKNTEPEISLLERMRASEHVNVKPVNGFPGIVAANFTRRAFQDSAWDEVSMHARGLFLDEETGAVVARGYEKFFHIGEHPGRDLAQWMNPQLTGYPVVAVKKYNGYLALVASIQGKLAVFSKSGVTPYADAAREMLMGAIGNDGAEQFRQMLERTKSTAVFEVLRSDDPHPITESGEDRLVLLDVIQNEARFNTNSKLAAGIAKRFGFEAAVDNVIGRANTPEEFTALRNLVAGRNDEGAVLIDSSGYRAKIKADIYAARKAARTALERYWRGSADSLGQRHAELEEHLSGNGALAGIREDRFTVTGLDGLPRLDLAGIFESDVLIGREEPEEPSPGKPLGQKEIAIASLGDQTNVFDVAEYILSQHGEMTVMKLQKLCYYSQAWHLAWDGETLFREEIQAWANGPVIPALYEAHRGVFAVGPGFFREQLKDPEVHQRVLACLQAQSE